MQWFGEREVFSAPFKVTPSSRQIFLGCLRDPGMGLSLRLPEVVLCSRAGSLVALVVKSSLIGDVGDN